MTFPNRPPRAPRPSIPRAAKNRQRPSVKRRRPPLAVEALEDRTVLNGTVKLSNGLLTITSTGNDTVLVQQVPGNNNQPNQVSVTLDRQTSAFKVTLVTQIQAQLNGGGDTFTLDHSNRPVTPPVSVTFQPKTTGNIVTVNGTNGADSFTVTSTTVGLTPAGTVAGTLTYANAQVLNVNGLGGTDTLTGTFASDFNGSLTNIESATLTVPGTVTATSTITVLETPGVPGTGVLSNSTFGSVAGKVVAGSIVNTTIGILAQGGSVTAQGQGTTSNVTIGTLSGSFTAPEDTTAGSGVMSSTSITSITSTGTVSTGSISGMTVGTADSGSSITASGQGNVSNVSISSLAGLLIAKPDSTPGSGLMNNVFIGTVESTAILKAGHFGVVAAQHSSPTVNFIELAAVGNTTVVTVTRTVAVTPHSTDHAVPDYAFYYDGGTDTPATPRAPWVVVQIAVGTPDFDLGVTTSTTTAHFFGFDLAGVYSDTPNVSTGIHNVEVGGDVLLNAVATNAVNFFKNTVGKPLLPNTTGGVQLPKDSIAVAAAGKLPAASIVAQSVSSVAAGSFEGVSANVATAGDALVPLAAGTTLVQANDTYHLFVSEASQVAQFLNTNTGSGSFDVKGVLFADQQADNSPVTVKEFVKASGNSSTIQTVDFTGQGASLQTAQPILTSITVATGGSLGDLTESAPGGLTAKVTAPSIIGNILVPKGAISNTIEATAGDIGSAFTDASGNITGVTTITTGGGGLTSTGKILAKGNLVSLLSLQSGLDGVVAAGGDIGVIQTVNGVAPAGSLSRFGGITVSTGGLNGQVIALGNVFGDISVTGGLSGRIGVQGKEELGLSAGKTFSRTGILGNVAISGGISTTGAVVSGGLIGDDGANSPDDTNGTHLTISGTDKGILAAGEDINFGATGSLNQAGIFENVATQGSPQYAGGTNINAIDAIFTDNNVELDVTHRDQSGQLDQLNLIIQDLLVLHVDAKTGNLTGTKS
jgi:hypothetical protein